MRLKSTYIAYLDDILNRALDDLPEVLPYNYSSTPDFTDLRERLDQLEQQHLVLRVLAWINDHSDWLTREGFHLTTHMLVQASVLEAHYSGNSPKQMRAQKRKGIPKGHAEAVKQLAIYLGPTAPEHQRPFIGQLALALNAVHWHPDEARSILAEALSPSMEDAQG